MTERRELIEVVEELKVSGSWLVPAGCKSVDVFLCGGGGGGGTTHTNNTYGGGGGGGGYTSIYYDIPVCYGEKTPVTIGEGGTHVLNTSPGKPGGTTLFRNTTYSAAGGQGGSYPYKGGNGGSGGGGYHGGRDGSNGGGNNAGLGQGTTTKCPFNDVYYGAGGGGASSAGPYQGYDGSGRGGYGEHALPNRGGGGGGSWRGGQGDVPAGRGGSGIIVLRYKKYV